MVAPEGKSFIAAVALVTLISASLAWGIGIAIFRLISLVLIVFLGFCFIFFRDPSRTIPVGDKIVLAPADGKVVDISQSENGEKKVSIFLSVFDVHRNRTPVNGLVTRVNYSKGKFLAAFNPDASEINEHTDVEIQSPGGIVRVRQIAGILARRIICHLKEGQQVSVGESLGFIRFGSRTDLVVPPGTSINVKIGDRVKSGSSIIGELS